MALWSMVGEQQPKRNGTSREPDKAMSEPREVKLLDAVAMLALNLESERTTTPRDQNIVFELRKDSELAGKGIEAYTIEGQNARDAAKSKGVQHQGHSQRKRPDALLRLLLWRVAQLITDEAVKTIQDPGKQVLLNLRAVGNTAKTSADMRATRCFVVPADDNHVKRIWAAESRPEPREWGKVHRPGGALAQFGIETEEDTVPTSKQAKLVSKLLNERRADQPRKSKKGKEDALVNTYRRCVNMARTDR